VKRRRREKISKKWQDILKKQCKEEQSGINYKTGIRNDGDDDEHGCNKRQSKARRLNKTVCKKPCMRCGRWDHTKLCKSCPQSKEYAPDFDELYKEWEASKQSKGEIPDSNNNKDTQNLGKYNQEVL
jgi:hypothetical protein